MQNARVEELVLSLYLIALCSVEISGSIFVQQLYSPVLSPVQL